MIASPSTDVDRVARLALSLITPPGQPAIAVRVAVEGAEATLAHAVQLAHRGRLPAPADIGTAMRARDDAQRLLAAADRRGWRWRVPGDPDWPAGLTTLPTCTQPAAPLGLWVTGPGRLADAAATAVVVTGSRHPTAYGAGLARDLGLDLAAAGRIVASGAAHGIDTAAAQGALLAPEGSPGPLAVLASGLDVAFPAGSGTLLSDIAARGLLVTRCPPGTRPDRARFAYRAWLLAALAPPA